METSGFWEGREDESHLEEKYSQAVSRNSPPLGSSFACCPAQDKGGSLKWDSVESLWNCVRASISGYDWGGRHVYRSGSEGKEICTTFRSDFSCDQWPCLYQRLLPHSSLCAFEPGDKVLLKTRTIASPESQLEEKWTGPWDILLTTPVVKLAGIKPWTHHTRVKQAQEEQWTTEPQEDPKVIFQNQWLMFFSLPLA